jgi:hypothetical protein
VSLRTATFVIANDIFFCEDKKSINGTRILVSVIADVWSCCGSFLRLRAPPQPTKRKIMHNELISHLSNGILSAIIALLFAVILSMHIGYRIVAKRLAKRGMKKGDAKALGQATASLIFLLLAGIYFKFVVLG